MKIGEVIRKYRKEKELTQEEMAKRLGVTASAVNKWENNAAYPDILLLAPIARLLDISMDTLLSYQEQLNDQEIRGLVTELNERLEKDDYEAAFCWAKVKIEKYPNSGHLIHSFAAILNAWRITKDIAVSEEKETYLVNCYERLLKHEDEKLRMAAADALFSWYLQREDYANAEKYLAYFSEQNPEKKRKQALIFSRTDRREEAYKAYEELLFTGHNMLNLVLGSIYTMAVEDEDLDRAVFLAEKIRQMELLFDMGTYHEASAGLQLKMLEKDVSGTVEYMKRLLDGIGTLGDFCRSRLYEHMKFKELSDEFVHNMKQNLTEYFGDEDSFGYLKGNEWWEELRRQKLPDSSR